MKKNICCSVSEETYANIQKAKFILSEKGKTLSEILSEGINKYAEEYDKIYQKIQRW